MRTNSAKYHAPMTPAHVIRSSPLATPHVHSHIITVPAMAQFAQLLTCHSNPDGSPKGFEKYPMRSKRNAKVRKGIDASSIASRTAGERPRRKGLAARIDVVRLRSEDAR